MPIRNWMPSRRAALMDSPPPVLPDSLRECLSELGPEGVEVLATRAVGVAKLAFLGDAEDGFVIEVGILSTRRAAVMSVP